MPSGSSIHISTSPQGSVTGSRMTGTPAIASRACSARTSRTWIQITSERPGAPDALPETSSNPWPRKKTIPGMARRAELPVDGQAQDVAVEAEAAVQVAGAQEDPAAENVHATIPPSRWSHGRPGRSRAIPPYGAQSDWRREFGVTLQNGRSARHRVFSTEARQDGIRGSPAPEARGTAWP